MIQRTVFTPGSRPSRWRQWLLNVLTGHYYNEVVINGRVHRFPGCILIHGDVLEIELIKRAGEVVRWELHVGPHR